MKPLNHRDEDIIQKAKLGLALNLGELAVSSGYGYDQWKKWKAAGLPMIAGKLPLREASRWARNYELKKATQSSSRRRSRPRAAIVSKFCAQV